MYEHTGSDFVPVATTDATGRITSTTRTYERINGGPPASSMPLGLRGLCPAEVAYLRAFVERVSNEPGATRWTECHLDDGRGRQRRLSVALSNRLDDSAIDGMLVELQEHAAVDSDLRIMLDVGGRVLSANSPMRRFLGSSSSEVGEAPRLLEHVHPADLARVRRAWNRALSGVGEAVRLEARLRRSDGAWRTIDIRLENRLDLPGVGAVVATASDLGPERDGDVPDFDRDTWLQEIFDELPWRVALFDADGSVQFASAGLGRDLGIREQEGGAASSAFEREVRHELASVLQRPTRSSGVHTISELRRMDRNEEYRWVAVYWLDRRDDPLLRGVLAIFIDTTARHELEARCRRAQKFEAIGQLTGGLTHDFNNLLGVIVGGLDLVVRSSELDPKTRDEVCVAQAAAQRAAGLSRQLLGMSRPGTPRVEEIDVVEFSHSLLEMLRPMLGENITSNISGALGRDFVRMERGHLEQILLNLCVNARDAMPTGGRISIRVDRERAGQAPEEASPRVPEVVLEVTDSGTGMSEQVLECAFDPYFTTKGGEEGSGLGLFMVDRVVSEAGGRVEIESEPGVGTTVRVTLPAVPPPPEKGEAVPSVPRAAVEDDSGIILVVEDERALLQVQLRMLERAGYDVLGADSVAAAIEVATAHDGPIDLLLTDLVLPDGHGTELARGLLARRPSMRVLYSTGYAPKEARLDVLEPGFPILNKPYTENDLLGHVRGALAGGA